MAFPHVWGSAEDNAPTGSTPVNQVDDYIIATRQMVRERISLEHNFAFTQDALQGSHRKGSARIWVSETEPSSPVPDATETETSVLAGRVWFKPSTNELYIHNGTTWDRKDLTYAELASLLGSNVTQKTTIVAADGILILDSASPSAPLKYVSYATIRDDVLSNRPWSTSNSDLQPPGTASVGNSGKIVHSNHVHPRGDADTLDGEHGSYYQPASTAITTSNIDSQSVAFATDATNAVNADTLDGQHGAYYLDLNNATNTARSSNTPYASKSFSLPARSNSDDFFIYRPAVLRMASTNLVLQIKYDSNYFTFSSGTICMALPGIYRVSNTTDYDSGGTLYCYGFYGGTTGSVWSLT